MLSPLLAAVATYASPDLSVAPVVTVLPDSSVTVAAAVVVLLSLAAVVVVSESRSVGALGSLRPERSSALPVWNGVITILPSLLPIFSGSSSELVSEVLLDETEPPLPTELLLQLTAKGSAIQATTAIAIILFLILFML